MRQLNRWFFALALLGAMSIASAQVSRCTPSVGQVNTVRGDGRNELLPEILIECTGDGGAGGANAVVRITSNVPITSRILEPNAVIQDEVVKDGSEAFLLVNDPPPAAQVGRPTALLTGHNVVQGYRRNGDPNSIFFDEIQWLRPGTLAQTRLRLVNLRVDPSSLRSDPSRDITISVAFASPASSPLISPSTIVAARADFTPLAMTLRQSSGSAPFTGGIAVCQGNKPSVTPSTARDFNIQFQESFAGQFKKRSIGAGAANPSALTAQAEPSVDYGTETGFYNPALAFQDRFDTRTGNMREGGPAAHGTRLRARFANIPSGATIYVTASQTAEGSASGILNARLVSSETGPFSQPPGSPYVALQAVNGTAQAVWEIVDASPDSAESLSFGVIVSASAGTGAGQITITGELAPQGVAATSVPAFSTPVPSATNLLINGCGAGGTVPTVTSSCPLPQATAGLSYAQPLTATGGAVPYRWSLSAGSLPPGLNIVESGSITGIPATAGTANFTLRATDGLGQAGTKACSLVVVQSGGNPGGPQLTSINPSSITRGAGDLQITLQGSGFNSSASVIWNVGTLAPASLATTFVDSATVRANVPASLLTTPAVVPVAVRTGALTATTTSNSLNFEVTGGLAITNTCPLPQAGTATPYSLQLNTAGGTAPYVWTHTGNLPPGFSLSAGGLLSGTAQTTGSYNFMLRVSDSAQQIATKDCALAVGATPSGQLSLTSLTPARLLAAGPASSLSLRGSGFSSNSAVIWNFGTAQQVTLATNFIDPTNLSAAIPANLIAAPGSIPVAVRNQTLTATTFSNVLNLEVAPGITISSPCPLPPATLNAPYSTGLNATGGIPPYAWSITEGSLQTGITLLQTGQISGAPSAAGLANFTLRVIDAQQNAASVPCSLRVTGPFQAAPNALSFTVPQGSAPVFQDVSLTSATGGLPLTFTTSNAPWLQVTNVGSKTPSRARVTVNPSALTPGNYSAAIAFAADGASNPTSPISVFLRVDPLPHSQLRALPAALTFSLPRGSTQRPEQHVYVANSGGTTQFSVLVVTISGGAWLSSPQTGGTVSSQLPRLLRFQANPAGLEAGTYLARIVIRNQAVEAETVTLLASLSISTAPDQLLTSTNTLQIRQPANISRPPLDFDILSTGQNSLFWQAQAATDSGGDWLQLITASDAAPPGRSSPASATIRTAGLLPGLYTGQIRVNANTDNAPRVIAAHLQVLPPVTVDEPYLSPGGLVFTASSGGANPAAKSLTLFSPGDTAPRASFSLSENEQIFRPTLDADGRTLRISPNIAGLAPGVYRAAVVVQIDGGIKTRTAALSLVVHPPSACIEQSLSITPVEPSGGFSSIAGSGLPIRVSVVDNCGMPAANATVSARIAGEAPVSLIHNGSGSWAADAAIPNRFASQQITIELQADTSGATGSAAIQGSVELDSAALPELSENGTLSNSTFQPGKPLAPGSLAASFGRNLAQNQSSAFPPTARLDQTSLFTPTGTGTAVPLLFFASSGQLVAELPRTLSTGVTRQIFARRGNLTSRPIDIAIAPAAPGIFTVSQTGTGQGAILDATASAQAGGAILAAPPTPAARGSVISIFCEGLGRTNPEPTPGQPAPSAEPLARATLPIAVTIGGLLAEITYAGLAPGFYGLYQVNAVIPLEATAGDSVPVVVTAAGIASNTATIAIR